MSVKETLKKIAELASLYKIDKPYIVGGLPRDLYLGKNVKTSDVDLTTNSPDVLRLGVLVSDMLNSPFQISEDGHVTVFTDEFDIDFSSNFVSKRVSDFLDEKHDRFHEAFSRDFTINTLHIDLVTGDYYDPTGMALQDIKSGIIRTPVPPEITFSDDPRRIYRAINLAVRYGFTIEDEIIQYARDNAEMFSGENIKEKYITIQINKALNEDPFKTIKLLKELGLFGQVPLSGQFKDFLIQEKLLVEYLGDEMSKTASLAGSWSEYEAQGDEYKELADWWRSNFSKFPNATPSYYSWASWYMDMYRNRWGGHHKGPVETLEIMKGSTNPIVSRKQERISKIDNILNSVNEKVKTSPVSPNLEVSIKPGVDIVNVTEDVKSFIKDLGKFSSETGIARPIITSGYRSPKTQTALMLKNWYNNGGLNGGRQYLEGLYGKPYGKLMSDVFERYGYSERSVDAALPIVNRFGSQHMKSPARAIDLAVTEGIERAIDYFKNKSNYRIRVIDETNTAGPHWHIVVYGKKDTRLASIKTRKNLLKKYSY